MKIRSSFDNIMEHMMIRSQNTGGL